MKDLLKFIEEIEKYVSLEGIENILECGSCDLCHATAFSNIFPNATVSTFECDPINLKTCKEKLAKEGKKNLNLYEVALTDYIGEIDFYPLDEVSSPSKNVGIGSVYKINPEYKKCEPLVQKTAIKVPCITVKKWAKDNFISGLDLLWLDAQGSELNILKGCGDMLSNIRAIQVEAELKNLYLNQPLHPEIDSFLSEAGFEYIKNNGISRGGWFMEAIYINRKFKK